MDAKKRYIMNAHNNEGVQYSEPKLKIQGIEAVKSYTPMVVRNKFKQAYKIILTSTEEELQKFVKDFYNEFTSLNPEEITFNLRGLPLTKWYDLQRYIKRVQPIHVRGTLFCLIII